MACAAPVVSTSAGALPEVVGDAGLLVPPADIKALVDAISALLTDSERRQSLGEAGYKRAIQNFNWRTAASRTLDVYAEKLGHNKRLNLK
jgi:glycosyltransferase involved in cell wall biosynthesis